MEEKKPFKLKISTKEFVFYLIAAIFGIWGLTFLIFGIIGSYLPVLESENWVSISEKAWLTNWSPWGYRGWGLLLMLIGCAIAFITLLVYARTSDKDVERANRRKQRLLLEEEAKAKAKAILEEEAKKEAEAIAASKQ